MRQKVHTGESAGFSLDRLSPAGAPGARRVEGDHCLGPARTCAGQGATLAIHPYGRSAVHPPARPAPGRVFGVVTGGADHVSNE
ncbi:hypothetical protein GCM10010425_67650 [Streptomyces spororaveus]|uniref:Uncharacterized protein n=1 Tax=Streptomyces spororaveus TaxID=284039 RepID=A0ABQ3TMW5_9ACTN|nr:hypothetical protein Sspor_68930 [Streptomyces spororaveus]